MLKLSWVEFKLFLREPVAAFFTLLFPLMLLFLFGGIYGNKASSFFGGFGMVDISVPSYTAMIIASSGLLGLSISISAYRETGVLRRLRATPLRPLTILGAQVIVLYSMTIAGMLILIVAGKAVYNLRFAGNPASLLAAFTLSAMSLFAMGFVVAGLAPTARVAQVVGMAIFYPMIFLSGATIPREVLPETMRQYSQVLPLAHAVNLLRGIWTGGAWGDYVKEVVVLLALFFAGALISARTFRWE